MQIRDVMTKNPIYVQPDTAVKTIAQQMRDSDCGIILVGENDRLTGVITDRDIVVRVMAEGKAPEGTMARDVMSRQVFFCFDNQTLEEATELMEEHKVRRLAVLNRDKRLVGMLSLSDIAAASNEPCLVNRIIQGGSKQTYAA